MGDDAFALDPVFSGGRKIVNLIGIALWAAAMLYFWAWWFQPSHIVTAIRYAAVTMIMLWITLIPAYFIFLFNDAQIPRRSAQPKPAGRVAIVVTKAPSEPFSIARTTLEAALAQEGCDHDTWLADEDPDPTTIDWCREHGVMISSRKGAADYQRETWPRRKNCKEGNLAYFYDHFGYDRYDFVSQFDIDHVPTPDYLTHAIAPFADPAVGYVSAPSICDSNADKSWSARGRLYVEASMHGALQAGYNDGWAPLCIGSHYTVRTCALRAAGGLGPELAEDHSTTLILNANGWKGVHAVDAIAHGQGPETFTDLIIQEFQWSRSLVTILLTYIPSYFSRLSPRLRFEFIFSELWYPLYSFIMAVALAIPIIALLTESQFMNMTFAAYLLHVWPLSLAILLLAFWWKSSRLFRPSDAKILSWEGMAFLFLRWPWSLIGSLTAVCDRIVGTRVAFRITPKGVLHADPIPFRIIAPYVSLAIASAGCAWLTEDPGTAAGFYIFNLVTAVGYCVLILTVLILHARENGCRIFAANSTGVASAISVLAIVVLIGLAARQNGVRGLAAMNEGVHAFALTETVYSQAGAGRTSSVTYRFRPRWRGFGLKGMKEKRDHRSRTGQEL